jgi:hypothetical protein
MIRRHVQLLAAVCCAVALLAVEPRVRADDSRGQHAVRGAGLISCGLYTEQRDAKSDVYLMTAAWIDGYVTGINQHAADTYDLLPFEGAELLMSILDKHCRAHAKDPVFGVLNSLFKQLWPDRLTTRSDKTAIDVGDQKTELYQAVISRIQQHLHARGLYDGPVNGAFSLQTIDALKRFQTSIAFEATGFPDQMTLWRLLRSEP